MDLRAHLRVVALASLSGGAWACASLGDLSGGGDAGDASRPDAGSADDGAHEDATHPDAARHDAPPEAPARDAGHGMDVVVAHEAACSPVVAEAGASPACPATDAGDASACAPQPVTMAALAWHPPHPQLHACSPAQVDALVTACLDPNHASMASCDAFQQGDGGATCADCMLSEPGATFYGPIVLAYDSIVLNVGGCIALADPCNLPCAKLDQAAELCGLASCAAACLPAEPTEAELTAFDSCSDVAASCVCNDVNVQRTACEQALATGPASGCVGSTDLLVTVKQVASLFCGTGAWDAGE